MRIIRHLYGLLIRFHRYKCNYRPKNFLVKKRHTLFDIINHSHFIEEPFALNPFTP